MNEQVEMVDGSANISGTLAECGAGYAAHALESFFYPGSIALVGASSDTTRYRGIILQLLRQNGYEGKIYPINPSYTEINGLTCFPSIRDIGAPIELAMIAIPAASVLAALEECAAVGVRYAIVISSGFAEEGGKSRAMQAEIARLAQRTGMRISGPNAEGFHNEIGKVSLTFSRTVDRLHGETRLKVSERRLGIISQSGGMGFALYARAEAMGVAFSHVISTGNEADLSAADFLDYLVDDERTHTVLLFLETVRNPSLFVAAAARAAANGKPVIVTKAGRSAAAERATASHTASMAGWNEAYEAIFAKYGFISASDPDQAVAIAAAFVTLPPAKGDRVGIVTVSGGCGAWAADLITAQDLQIPELSVATQKKIRQIIPSYGSSRNPVDITAQAVSTGGFQKIIEMLTQSDEVDIIFAALSLAGEKRLVPFDLEILKHTIDSQRKPVLFYTYTLPSQLALTSLGRAGVVVYRNLTEISVAAARLASLGRFEWSQPGGPLPDLSALEAKIRRVGRAFSEYDTKVVLREAGIALPLERLVKTPDELDAAIVDLGFPLAMKIQSPDILHKSEHGGVKLSIDTAEEACSAFGALLENAQRSHPHADVQGVLVSRMAPKGVEIIVGTMRDDDFGPIVMIGFGGVTTELFKDVVYRPAPVSRREAEAMLARLKAAPLLSGFRGRPKADVAAFIDLVVQVSEFSASLRQTVAELELNPVVVHPEGEGVSIIDALLVPVGSKRTGRRESRRK